MAAPSSSLNTLYRIMSYCMHTYRFIAVTRPIQYAKHRNSCRVYVTLALTWIVSIAVSLPIPLGMNYTPRRARTPWLCILYNSDFIIFSSMTSFYVPCVLMIFLYWRTFRAISARASKMATSAAARRRKSVEVTLTPATGCPRTRAVELADTDERQPQRPAAATIVVQAVVNGSSAVVDEATTPILGDQKDSTATKYPDYQTMRSGEDEGQPTTATSDLDGGGHGEGSAENDTGTTTTAAAGTADDDVTQLAVRGSSQKQRRRRRLTVVQPLHDSPSPARRSLLRSGRQHPPPAAADSRQRAAGKTSGLRMRRSAIFAFGLQRMVQKPEKLSTKRERKATQTLAIVLGTSTAS